jgi:uncharacterized cupin superfamily protein
LPGNEAAKFKVGNANLEFASVLQGATTARDRDMNRYAITEKAGRFVAGQTNTGVGTVLTLTDKQAEHELRLGTLRPLDVVAQPEPSAAKTSPKSAPRGARAKKSSRTEPDVVSDEVTSADAEAEAALQDNTDDAG